MSSNQVKVLDHGSVRLVESYGSDEAIIEAARMSTSKGFQGWTQECSCCHGDQYCEYAGGVAGPCSTCKGTGEVEGDTKLLRYLYTNRHMTPFEMAGAIFEIQAPIFVFREWHRHRTQSYNELSARYTPIPNVNYVPTKERLLQNADGTNKQAGTTKDSEKLCDESATDYLEELNQIYATLEASYQSALKRGVPKEVARIILPVGRYSRMRASANLRNWLQFLSLRQDTSAQWEIRQYANVVADLLTEKFPRTMELYTNGK